MLPSVLLVGLTAMASQAVRAQFHKVDGQYRCDVQGYALYCDTDPTTGYALRISCAGGTGEAEQCGSLLSGVPPTGFKSDATCYASSPDSGDACCALDGVAYCGDHQVTFSASTTTPASTTSTSSTADSTTSDPSTPVTSTTFPPTPYSTTAVSTSTTCSTTLVPVGPTNGTFPPVPTFVAGASNLKAAVVQGVAAVALGVAYVL